MTVYLVMYMLMLLGSLFISNSNRPVEQKRKQLTIYTTLLISVVIGLRHPSMGWDLQYQKPYGYLWSFECISNLSLFEVIKGVSWQNYEWGYILYNKLLSFVSINSSWLLFVSAVLSYVPVGIMIGRLSKDPLFSWIVYLGLPCFLMPFSGLRQGIAIGIVCLSFLYIQQRKLLKFAIVVLLAGLFHRTALIALIAYPLYSLKIKPQIRIWSIPVLLVVFVLRVPLFTVASKLFKDNASIDNNNAIILLIVFVLIYMFCSLFLKSEDNESAGFLNLFYFACICQVFGGVNHLAIRVGYYFMPPLVLALPGIVKNMMISNRRLSRPLIMSIFAVYGLFAMYSSGWAMAYPYHFFWSKI